MILMILLFFVTVLAFWLSAALVSDIHKMKALFDRFLPAVCFRLR